jgi:DnaJ-class molecular chaperone
MPQEDLKKYFDILELNSSAPLRDIHRAYLRLKKLYSEDSIVLEALAEEFPEKKRKKILRQVEDAYAKLQAARKGEIPQTNRMTADEPSAEKLPQELVIDYPSFSGAALREIRERRKIRLDDISKQLKLRLELLKNIEEEKFEALPEIIYLKGHLKGLAGCLFLDPDKVAADYLKRFREKRRK